MQVADNQHYIAQITAQFRHLTSKNEGICEKMQYGNNKVLICK